MEVGKLRDSLQSDFFSSLSQTFSLCYESHKSMHEKTEQTRVRKVPIITYQRRNKKKGEGEFTKLVPAINLLQKNLATLKDPDQQVATEIWAALPQGSASREEQERERRGGMGNPKFEFEEKETYQASEKMVQLLSGQVSSLCGGEQRGRLQGPQIYGTLKGWDEAKHQVRTEVLSETEWRRNRANSGESTQSTMEKAKLTISGNHAGLNLGPISLEKEGHSKLEGDPAQQPSAPKKGSYQPTLITGPKYVPETKQMQPESVENTERAMQRIIPFHSVIPPEPAGKGREEGTCNENN